MFKRILVMFTLIVSLPLYNFAQSNGILPFTGCRYFNEGITVKSIDIKVDAGFLLNNRVLLNKEVEILFQLPAGFTEDRAKTVFVAAELTITNLKGAVLFKNPNYFKDQEIKGFQQVSIKALQVKVPLKQEILKAEPECIVTVRIYDLKSKNQLRIELPLTIAKPGEAMQTSKLINDIKASNILYAISAGLKIKKLDVSTDTSIRVNPKMAYLSLDMKEIEGSSMTEVLSGKESFWVYDNALKEIKIPDKQLKQVKCSMEDNLVDYLSKIPFRLKTMTGKTFFIRFRWESADRKKVIEVVVNR